METTGVGLTCIGILDKGKFIISKERANDWNADDRIEDEYMDTLIPKKNQPPTEKGYDRDYASHSNTATTGVPLQSPFKGKILRKTNGSNNGDPFYAKRS